MASDPHAENIDGDDLPSVPLGGTRAQAVQRLQVGVSGLVMMLLLVGLANVVLDRAQESEASKVPEAASTLGVEVPSAPSDPLADAGVIPELPVPSETPASQPEAVDENLSAQP